MDFLIHATYNPCSTQSDRTDGKIWLIGNHIKNLIPMRNSLTDLDLALAIVGKKTKTLYDSCKAYGLAASIDKSTQF